jgi:hypothetical protein
MYIYFSPNMRSVFNYLRPLKLDFAFLRTDCTGNNSLISYPARFGISIVVLLGLFVWFLLMALIYQYLRERKHCRKLRDAWTGDLQNINDLNQLSNTLRMDTMRMRTDSSANQSSDSKKMGMWIPWEWLKSPSRPRVMRSLIFLIVIAHLQFTSLCLTIINCTDYSIYQEAPDESGSDPLRMRAEQSQVCYQRTHFAAAFFSWIFIFAFSMALPLYFLRKLYMGYKHNLFETIEFRKSYGFMYRRIKHQYFWYRSTAWLWSFVGALETSVLPRDFFVQIPVLLAIASIEAFLLIYFQPMINRTELIQPLGIIVLKFLGSGLLFLTVQQTGIGSFLIVISVLSVLYLAYLYRKWQQCEPNKQLGVLHSTQTEAHGLEMVGSIKQHKDEPGNLTHLAKAPDSDIVSPASPTNGMSFASASSLIEEIHDPEDRDRVGLSPVSFKSPSHLGHPSISTNQHPSVSAVNLHLSEISSPSAVGIDEIAQGRRRLESFDVNRDMNPFHQLTRSIEAQQKAHGEGIGSAIDPNNPWNAQLLALGASSVNKNQEPRTAQEGYAQAGHVHAGQVDSLSIHHQPPPINPQSSLSPRSATITLSLAQDQSHNRSSSGAHLAEPPQSRMLEGQGRASSNSWSGSEWYGAEGASPSGKRLPPPLPTKETIPPPVPKKTR